MALTTPGRTLKREQPRDIGLYVCNAKACTVHMELRSEGKRVEARPAAADPRRALPYRRRWLSSPVQKTVGW